MRVFLWILAVAVGIATPVFGFEVKHTFLKTAPGPNGQLFVLSYDSASFVLHTVAPLANDRRQVFELARTRLNLLPKLLHSFQQLLILRDGSAVLIGHAYSRRPRANYFIGDSRDELFFLAIERVSRAPD